MSRLLDKLVVAAQTKPPPRIQKLKTGRPRETFEWKLAECRRMARWRRAHQDFQHRMQFYTALRECLKRYRKTDDIRWMWLVAKMRRNRDKQDHAAAVAFYKRQSKTLLRLKSGPGVWPVYVVK